MKVDNFNHLKVYFARLRDPNHFYFVQVLRRKKDDGEPPNFHVIRNYHLFSKEEFEKNIPGIIELCEHNNARAYFWINPRDAQQIALETSKALIDHVVNKTVKRSYRTYDHICGKSKCTQYEQLWIVDIDDKDKLIEIVNSIPADKIFDMVETSQGYHIITNKFDSRELQEKYKLDIHRDNPTLLYYAEDGRSHM